MSIVAFTSNNRVEISSYIQKRSRGFCNSFGGGQQPLYYSSWVAKDYEIVKNNQKK